jgi:ribosomal protein S18 acetylase RimI-like enzyme
MEYTYRVGNKDDIEQLQKVWWAAYGPFQSKLSEEFWEKWKAGFQLENVADLLNRAVCFVCETKGEIVGMAFLIPSGNPYWYFQEDWSYIRYVGVQPQHEGKGVGKKLTTLCIDEAKNSGEKIVALHTSVLQDAARHIYENMGFEKQQAVLLFTVQYWIYTLALTEDKPAVI